MIERLRLLWLRALRAAPKSISLIFPLRVRWILSGLMSRCRDALGVHGGVSVEHRQHYAQPRLERDGAAAAGEKFLEGHAIQELHRQVGSAVLAEDGIDADDIGVGRELLQHAGFFEETVEAPVEFLAR